MEASEIIKEFQNIIPKLTFEAHKGQAGRIGVVGGSKNYTGAPYFAAMSALKVGCDLVHVLCTQDASPVIKSYSPELIVHPVLGSQTFHSEIPTLLPRLHSLVIGPGLGRDENIFQETKYIIDSAKAQNMSLVFDADSLFYINSNLDLVKNYRQSILTPNAVEFDRLYKAATNKTHDRDTVVKDVEELANVLGNVTIVRKGFVDVITDGTNTVVCDEFGSFRRCGGQGDVLCGFMGVFSYWANKNMNLSINPMIIAAFGACLLARRCSNLAFQKFKRSMISSNLIDEIHQAFTSVFESV